MVTRRLSSTNQPDGPSTTPVPPRAPGLIGDTTTATPGFYAGKTDLEMGGEWQAQIKYDGPAGNGTANLPIVAQ